MRRKKRRKRRGSGQLEEEQMEEEFFQSFISICETVALHLRQTCGPIVCALINLRMTTNLNISAFGVYLCVNARMCAWLLLGCACVCVKMSR